LNYNYFFQIPELFFYYKKVYNMNMQHVRTWHLGRTDGHTDRRFADLGPIEHLFFLPRERRIMTSIIPRKLGRGKSPPRIILLNY
jgi:hypothetical protein